MRCRITRPPGTAASLALNDETRATFASGAVIHLCSSGSASELRCRIEAEREGSFAAINREMLARFRPGHHGKDHYTETTHSNPELSAAEASWVRVAAPVLVAIGADASAAFSIGGM